MHDDFAASLAASRRRRRRLADRLEAVRRRRSRRSTTASIAALLAVTAAAPLAVGATTGGTTAHKADTGSGMLQRGASGPAVKALQRALGISADGEYGPATARAVKRFQRRKGLEADGVAGPQTLAALGLRAGEDAQEPAAPAGDPAAILAAIAQCESGGDPTAISSSGRYRGKYQFSRATWRTVGGTGDPAAAPEAEQDARAAQLYAARGTKPWPVCGRKARAALAS